MHKMTSVDPYFYYSSKLREVCFNEAKIIVIIGYSYADEYVNVILAQALNAKSNLRIINVSPWKEGLEIIKKDIAQKLHIENPDQIIPVQATAKQFLTDIMNKEYLASQLAEPDDVPFN